MDSAIDVLHLLKKKIEVEGEKITNKPEVKPEKKKPKKTQKQIFEIKSK